MDPCGPSVGIRERSLEEAGSAGCSVTAQHGDPQRTTTAGLTDAYQQVQLVTCYKGRLAVRVYGEGWVVLCWTASDEIEDLRSIHDLANPTREGKEGRVIHGS